MTTPRPQPPDPAGDQPTPAPEAQLLDLRRGELRRLETPAGVVRSGIHKLPVSGPARVGKRGLERDRQGDRANHGGPDKALCVYPAERYPYWTRRLGRRFGPGDFGENLTTLGLDERGVCIGDVFALGTALLQVSQPRQPCYRLAALHELPQLAAHVQRTGFTGWYLRVLRAGEVERGQRLVLLNRPWPQLTIAAANHIVHHARDDVEGARRLLVPELSASWTQRLRARLERREPPDEQRRLLGAG
jgi:MOSC domain-containing protein YiiM